MSDKEKQLPSDEKQVPPSDSPKALGKASIPRSFEPGLPMRPSVEHRRDIEVQPGSLVEYKYIDEKSHARQGLFYIIKNERSLDKLPQAVHEKWLTRSRHKGARFVDPASTLGEALLGAQSGQKMTVSVQVKKNKIVEREITILSIRNT